MPIISILQSQPISLTYEIPTRENFKVDFVDSKANKTVTVTRVWGSSPEVPTFILWEGAAYDAAGDYTQSQIEQAAWDKLTAVAS